MWKAIWLPFAAALIVALAIGAGMAQAANFKAGEYPATVTGKQGGEHAPPPPPATGGGTLVIGFENSLMLSCTAGTFEASLSEPASSLATTTSLVGCSFFGLPATASMNGCEIVLNAGTGSKDEFTGSLGIACPAETKILIAVNNAFAICEVEIGSQTGSGSVEYVNLTEESPIAFTAGFETHSLAYTKTKSTGLCPLAGTGSKADGVITGGATFTSGTSLWVE